MNPVICDNDSAVLIGIRIGIVAGTGADFGYAAGTIDIITITAVIAFLKIIRAIGLQHSDAIVVTVFRPAGLAGIALRIVYII